MKQGRDEPVQEFFARIGDTSYNYKVKKPNADIRGPVIVIPEDHRGFGTIHGLTIGSSTRSA
jgi:hypothetical protein